ncbi:MAG: Hsp20/alpha crystallin family protein [bacterium]|nr:Hsp20/alpha crystallin family protein [bacterium]
MATMIRWNPVRELAAMQSAMDRLFDETWRTVSPTNDTTEYRLALDVHEAGDHYTVLASLPGVAADSLNVSLHDDVLTISAALPAAPAAEGVRVLLAERTEGKVSRSIRLPQPVNADAVEASLDAGILTLRLPKVPEVQPRTITIKTTHSTN